MLIRSRHPYYTERALTKKEVSGCVLEETLYSAGSRVPQHSHNVGYFCIALSGNCRERFGTKTRDWKTLSWGFFPIGEAHSFEFDSEARSFGIDISPQSRPGACLFNSPKSFGTFSRGHNGPDVDETLLRGSPHGWSFTVSNRRSGP